MLILIALALLVTGCAIASASTGTHTVQPGDTLAKIASAHDTTVDRLVELNQETYPSLVTDPGAIEVGWKLKIPRSNGGIQVTVKKTPSLGSGPTAVPLDRDAFEIEVVRLVNEERVKAGLTPLEVDPGLMQFARERSEDMVKRGYLGHNDPVTGQYLGGNNWENATQLLRTTNPTSENTRRAVSNWMKSPGHKQNILLANTKRTGVGIAIGSSHIIVTQVFAE
jgi:uncharacterized protein YkwD